MEKMEKTIYASSVAKLDSSVYDGGGTDDTEALQALLDSAAERGHLHLIMDGAALVSGLKIHSNTTIECPNRDCGFFLADGSDCSVIENAERDYFERKTRNVALIGGTYNHNAKGQQHHCRVEDPALLFGGPYNAALDMDENRLVIAMEFYGIENFLMRDLVIRNQRTWGLIVCNFKHVTIEGCRFDLPEKMFAQNQDGFHFWGPGQFLTIRDVGGRVGDDFMNIGPDEHDQKSDITDVLIDGVMLDEADQAIRMLSRGTGRLDRVVVRNVTGTYHGIGFYINQWFPPHYGNFGNIVFENIDMRPKSPTYNPDCPFLFQLGGNIECMTFKNIYHHRPEYRYNLFRIGYPFADQNYPIPPDYKPHIGTLLIDGVHIEEYDSSTAENDYILVRCPVENMIIRDVDVIRGGDVQPVGRMLKTLEGCEIGTLLVDRVYAKKMGEFIRAEQGTIDRLIVKNAIADAFENRFVVSSDGAIKEKVEML